MSLTGGRAAISLVQCHTVCHTQLINNPADTQTIVAYIAMKITR